jgi:hypothetical protein
VNALFLENYLGVILMDTTPTIIQDIIFQIGRCQPNNELINLLTFATIIFVTHLTRKF